MTNKAISKIGKYAAKKISKPYERLKREVFGIKPLNIGEKETIKCLQNPHNSLNYCKSVGNTARKAYHKTGKYK